MKQKTAWMNNDDVERQWYIVEVKDLILGRVSTEIASLLIGKKKVNKVPNVDAGDYVVVVNAAEVKVSRNKGSKKTYFRHSGYPGGAKTITFDKQIDKDPTFVIEKAVKNMLPKNKLRDGRMTRLFVYSGPDHKQVAQSPKEYKLSEA